VVDLDGARAGEPQNLDTIRAIVAAVGMSVEVGGGIRTTESVADVQAMGVWRVVVGTRAVREPEWLREVAGRFPGRVALAVDAWGAGAVAVEGWRRKTDMMLADVFQSAKGLNLAAIVYTDISRDGMMAGPNFVATKALAQVAQVDLIASGGISTLGDVERLRQDGADGAIIGRALYDGKITLEAALEAAGEQNA
jgi:phosphoribosylformimino-5-aminoimidazole carboxamide ribotide isomerase